MRTLILFLSISFIFLGCSESNSQNDQDNLPVNLSSEAKLYELSLEYEKSVFRVEIDGNQLTILRDLPKDVTQFKVKSLRYSEGATTSLKIGGTIDLSQNPTSFSITSENGENSINYAILYESLDYTSIVDKHGALSVTGNKIVDKNSEPVSLAGNSFFWSNKNWGGEKYYKSSVVSWLKLDWETTIVRAAMGVDEPGGYIEDPLGNKNKVKRIVDAAIDEGMYVIIDWHSHHAEDYRAEAVAFFQEMAQLYGEYDNVIYEIYNEPLDVSWSNTIKPYAEEVIAAIRAIDSDNLILVGTPVWSQRVDHAANDPIVSSENIAYVLHFYSVHHQQWLRDVATSALSKGIAIFVSEWGPLGYTQNDAEAEKWMDWCKQHNISHCSWAVNDKEEEWSILKPGTSSVGGWSDESLTESGFLERTIIRNWNNR